MHSWLLVSVLANYLHAKTLYISMVHPVSAYIMGSHIVYKPVLLKIRSLKAIQVNVFLKHM
jgi:hypothetical protein